VVDIDVAVAVFDDAVSVAVLDVARQRAPVVDRFVGVFAGADDRRLLPALSWRRESWDQSLPLAAAAAAVVVGNSRRVKLFSMSSPIFLSEFRNDITFRISSCVSVLPNGCIAPAPPA
jgi:hypothetical protein